MQKRKVNCPIYHIIGETLNVCRTKYKKVSTTLTELSSDPVTMREQSGEKAQHLTQSEWPLKTCKRSPDDAFHSCGKKINTDERLVVLNLGYCMGTLLKLFKQIEKFIQYITERYIKSFLEQAEHFCDYLSISSPHPPLAQVQF